MLRKREQNPRENQNISSLDDLAKIRGVGPETLADIKRIYSSLDDLVDALEADTVPLRNDIVNKIKVALV